MVLEAIPYLTLALCKCQKWNEQVKVSKCRKFGDLTLKTVARHVLVKFLKTIKWQRIFRNLACDALLASIPCKLPYILFEFRGIFLFLKTSLMSQFSKLNPQTFGTYWLSPALSISVLIQSANVRFSIASRTVRRVYRSLQDIREVE